SGLDKIYKSEKSHQRFIMHSKSNRLFQLWAMSVLLAFAGSALSDANIPPLETGKILTRTYDFKEAGKPMEYVLYVPTKYNPKKATPLVVLMHGLGSTPQRVMAYD